MSEGSQIQHFQSSLGAAGLKVAAVVLLDPAAEGYAAVPEEIRAAAYLGVVDQGWTIDGLKGIMRRLMGRRYDETTGDMVIESLKDAAAKHPNIITKEAAPCDR